MTYLPFRRVRPGPDREQVVIIFLVKIEKATISIGSLSQIVQNVVSSVAETEHAALFKNGQRCCIFEKILSDIGYPHLKSNRC